MHPAVMQWIRKHTDGKTFFNVLDVGGQDVNGSPRGIISMADSGKFTVVDEVTGQGVDVVANAHKLPFDDNIFDLVLCTEVLEHDSAPWETIKEIHRVLQLDGELVLTCANEMRAPHESFFCSGIIGYHRLNAHEVIRDLHQAGFRRFEMENKDTDIRIWAIKEK
jgi:SAM-dependent methyltransferase